MVNLGGEEGDIEMKTRLFFIVMGLMLVMFCYTSAQVPQLINYQGKLTKATGASLDTTIQMVFTIYADSNGTTSLWTETQGGVKVEKGVFNVLLGSVVPVSYSAFDGNVRYLGVKVGGDPEITPRKAMVSVAYAYRAEVCGGGVPVGSIVVYGSPVCPAGWLICDGSEISRTSYAELFSAIGTIWGDGDGLTTFNLPDLRGRGPIGKGQGSGLTNRIVGDMGGEEQHTLTVNEIPPHSHDIKANDGTPGPYSWLLHNLINAQHTHTRTTESTGGGQSHNNMPPYAVVNFIIKY